MSQSKTIFNILWQHAATSPGPFEVGDVASQVADDPEEAAHSIRQLVEELERMPEGKQYFALKGNAVVPLAEYSQAHDIGITSDEAYPYED